MKKLTLAVLIVLALVFASSVVKAEETVEKKEEKTFSLSGKLGVFAPYVNEYTGEYISGGPISQPSVTLTHNPSGLYISALGYITRSGVDEVDLYVGKSTEIKGVTLDTGIGFYDVNKLNNIDSDFFAVYMGADFPEVIGIIPFVYIEGDIPFKKELAEGGVLWKLGVEKSIPVSKKQSIDLKFEAGGNDGIYSSAPMLVNFARGTALTTVKFWGLNFSPSVSFQKGFGGIAGREWRTIAGLAIAF